MILTGGNRNSRRETCRGATLSAINPTWTGRGSNLDLRGEKPVLHCLRQGTACEVTYVYCTWHKKITGINCHCTVQSHLKTLSFLGLERCIFLK
jgi:hypothetical protein